MLQSTVSYSSTPASIRRRNPLLESCSFHALAQQGRPILTIPLYFSSTCGQLVLMIEIAAAATPSTTILPLPCGLWADKVQCCKRFSSPVFTILSDIVLALVPELCSPIDVESATPAMQKITARIILSVRLRRCTLETRTLSSTPVSFSETKSLVFAMCLWDDTACLSSVQNNQCKSPGQLALSMCLLLYL